MRRKRFAFIALLAAAGLTLSGCFAFGGIIFTKTKLKPGQSSTARITVFPIDKSADSAVFFVYVGIPDDGSVTVKNRKFDVTRKFGNNPKPLLSETAIRDELNSTDDCDPPLSDNEFANTTWRVYRTPGRIDDQGKPQKQAVVQMKFKQVALRDIADTLGSSTQIPIATGFWDDDGDGDPEAGVVGELECTGGAVSNLFLKSTSSKRSDAEVARAQREALSNR